MPPTPDPSPEPPVRHLLAGGRIGVCSWRELVRTSAQLALWLGTPPLLARLLGRAGARGPLHRTERAWARGVRRALGMRLHLEGLEQVDPRERYLIAPLHEGFVDAVALLHLPLPLRFAVRDELLEWRWLGGYLRDAGHIPVCPERGAWSYRALLRAAREVLDAGDSLVVFPQGSILGIETEFRGGAFRLAQSLGCPILPVALTGSHRVWEHPYTPRLRFGQRVTLRVLPPIPASEVRARGPERVRRTLQRTLKAAALDGRMEPPRRFHPERDGFWDGYAYEIDPAYPELAARVARRRAAGGPAEPDRSTPG